jgi:hypothetical protein
MRKRNLDNRGSALVVTLAILSLLAILGAIGISTAVVNIRMRSMNRMADRNFYQLEAIWDEIYEKLGCQVSEIIKQDYADVLAKLYQTEYETNEQANSKLRALFKQHIGTLLESEETSANLLDSYYGDEAENHLEVVVGTLDNSLVNGYCLRDLSLTYQDPQTGTSALITMDLEISVPDLQFIDGTEAFSDYILITNGDINIKKPGNRNAGNLQSEIEGSVRADQINVKEADVTMSGSKLVAAKAIHIGADNTQSSLEIGSDSSVWAKDIILSGNGSKLHTNGADLNIKDDLTIDHDNCKVELIGGNYYGYGNEGNPVYGADHTASSAIIVKGKNNYLDIETDSLTLAGHSYLKFEGSSQKKNQAASQTYPMAESIALKTTQPIYLIPEDQLQLVIEGVSQTTGNPILLPDGAFRVAVSIGEQTKLYDISSKLSSTEENDPEVIKEEDVIFVKQHQRLYVFYNFDNDSTGKERKEYFEEFLADKDHKDTFQALLQKTGWGRQESEEAGIYIKDSTNIVSAGSIYKVAEDEKSTYTVIPDTGTTSTMTLIRKIAALQSTFANLDRYLTETTPRAVRTNANLPVGQYIKKSALTDSVHDNLVYATPDSCTLNVNGEMEGLVISGGKVTITGSGTFRGLILSFGAVGTDGSLEGIDISGDVTLIADPAVVQECIGSGAGTYLYDYSENADTVLNDYRWFVKESNWVRGKRIASGGTS